MAGAQPAQRLGRARERVVESSSRYAVRAHAFGAGVLDRLDDGHSVLRVGVTRVTLLATRATGRFPTSWIPAVLSYEERGRRATRWIGPNRPIPSGCC